MSGPGHNMSCLPVSCFSLKDYSIPVTRFLEVMCYTSADFPRSFLAASTVRVLYPWGKAFSRWRTGSVKVQLWWSPHKNMVAKWGRAFFDCSSHFLWEWVVWSVALPDMSIPHVRQQNVLLTGTEKRQPGTKWFIMTFVSFSRWVMTCYDITTVICWLKVWISVWWHFPNVKWLWFQPEKKFTEENTVFFIFLSFFKWVS